MNKKARNLAITGAALMASVSLSGSLGGHSGAINNGGNIVSAASDYKSEHGSKTDFSGTQEVGGIIYNTSDGVAVSSDISYVRTSGYRTPVISFELQKWNSGSIFGWGSGWTTLASQQHTSPLKYDISLSGSSSNGGQFRVLAHAEDGNTYSVYTDTFARVSK